MDRFNKECLMGQHKFKDSTSSSPLQEIVVPAEVMFQVRLSDYDRTISDLEAQIAVLKRERANYIHDENIKIIKNKYGTPKPAPTQYSNSGLYLQPNEGI